MNRISFKIISGQPTATLHWMDKDCSCSLFLTAADTGRERHLLGAAAASQATQTTSSAGTLPWLGLVVLYTCNIIKGKR